MRRQQMVADKKHAKLAPSASARWIACPGSIKLCEQVLEKPTSSYAQEGTVAHALGELCLNVGEPAEKYVGQNSPINEYDSVVTEEMAEAVQVYVDYVQKIQHEDKDNLCVVETTFDLSWLYPGITGTLDCFVYNRKTQILTVIDYKHGSGVSVYPKWNSQLMIYALGASRELQDKIKTVNLVIVQPRIFGEEAIREWELPLEELYHWGIAVMRPAAYIAETDDAWLSAGEHCRFCGALAVCPEQVKTALAVAKTDFDKPVLPAPSELTPEELSKVLSLAKIINAWVGEVEGYAQRQMEAGIHYPGYKLVNKRANRKWVDENAATTVLTNTLGEGAFTKKLLSVAQAEKMLKKKAKADQEEFPFEQFNQLCEKPDAGLTIAPVTDRRKAAVSSDMLELVDTADIFQD